MAQVPCRETGLDARAAAIVMRTVRNTVDTGRTVVCTIHQPSIDIFEVRRSFTQHAETPMTTGLYANASTHCCLPAPALTLIAGLDT